MQRARKIIKELKTKEHDLADMVLQGHSATSMKLPTQTTTVSKTKIVIREPAAERQNNFNQRKYLRKQSEFAKKPKLEQACKFIVFGNKQRLEPDSSPDSTTRKNAENNRPSSGFILDRSESSTKQRGSPEM